VGIGGHRRSVVVQSHDPESRGFSEARALDHVADEMRRGRCAAAVAGDENCPPMIAPFFEPSDGASALFQVGRVDGLKKLLAIMPGKGHNSTSLYTGCNGPPYLEGGLSLPAREFDPEGLPDSLPQHVPGRAVVADQSDRDDGRAHFHFSGS